MNKENLSLSESAAPPEYGKGCRVPKRKQNSDVDTDTESDNSSEDVSINFPTYKPDKTVISSNSAYKDIR